MPLALKYSSRFLYWALQSRQKASIGWQSQRYGWLKARGMSIPLVAARARTVLAWWIFALSRKMASFSPPWNLALRSCSSYNMSCWLQLLCL